MRKVSSMGAFLGAVATALALSLSCVGHAAAKSAVAAKPMLKSLSVDLPNSARMFPSGPGSEAINNNCLTCHSAGMVLYQPAMSEAAWSAIVHKMIAVFKAPIADQDATAIIAYLVRLKGAAAPH